MAETIREYQIRIGRKGGKARAKKLSPARLSEIARLAARTRWTKKRKTA